MHLRPSMLSMDEPHVVKFAKIPHLWALGVGAVISGDFFGWQSALVGGFIGLLLCLCPVTVLYSILSLSIAELSTAVPAGGGPYVFALRSMGTGAAYAAGVAELLKVIVTCAVVVVGIGSYLGQILDIDQAYGPLWWALFYLMFLGLNIAGVQQSFQFQLVSTVISLVVLLVFYIGAATLVDYNRWVVEANDWVLPDGITGALKGLSFSMWFFLGIEELPLAVEEAVNPVQHMPISVATSVITLLMLALSTSFFSSTIFPGAYEVYQSDTPLLVGYKSVFGDNNVTSGFSWILLVGLICSFHSFVFCMGRLIYAIARDDLLPRQLAQLHPTRNTPYVALIAGCLLGYIIAIILHYTIGDLRLGAVLINLALLGGLVSYFFQLLSFILLRRQQPSLHRPYRSHFGAPGAYIALFIVLFIFATIVYQGIDDSDYIASMIGAIGYFAIAGVAYFTRSNKASKHSILEQAVPSA